MTNQEILNHSWVVVRQGVEPKQEIIDLIHAIICNHKDISHRRIYIVEDSRGQVICDNFDYPNGILLAHHDDKGYSIHSRSTLRGKYCSLEVASKGAKTFFTPIGENVFDNLQVPTYY